MPVSETSVKGQALENFLRGFRSDATGKTVELPPELDAVVGNPPYTRQEELGTYKLLKIYSHILQIQDTTSITNKDALNSKTLHHNYQ